MISLSNQLNDLWYWQTVLQKGSTNGQCNTKTWLDILSHQRNRNSNYTEGPEMAHWVKKAAAKSDNLSSIPGTHTKVKGDKIPQSCSLTDLHTHTVACTLETLLVCFVRWSVCLHTLEGPWHVFVESCYYHWPPFYMPLILKLEFAPTEPFPNQAYDNYEMICQYLYTTI